MTERTIQESRKANIIAQDIGRGIRRQGREFERFFYQVRNAADLSGGAKQWAPEALSGARCNAALNELCLIAKQRNLYENREMEGNK